MTNKPPTADIYDDPHDSKPKIAYERDTKVPNAGTFVIRKEDHTLGNLLKNALLENPQVLFAGYKAPHPLDMEIHLRVQTTGETDPITVVQEVFERLRDSVSLLEERFTEKVKQLQQNREQ